MLDGYVSEKEQLEVIKKWWHEYGKWIAMAVVVGALLGVGWRYFHGITIRRLENASQIYQSVLDADQQSQFNTSQNGATILMKNFAHTPYAGLSALLWAKEAVAKNQLDVALSKLTWVIDHASSFRQKQIARILAARILLSQNKTPEAASVLTIVNDKDFLPLIHWVRGDIASKMGQSTLAKTDYQRAKNALSDMPFAQEILSKQLAQP